MDNKRNSRIDGGKTRIDNNKQGKYISLKWEILKESRKVREESIEEKCEKIEKRILGRID